MNHLWSRRDEWYRVHTAFKRISRKTEIARSARGLTLQEPRAEDVLAESYLAQKILVILITAGHKFLSEGCEYLETITDMQLLCKTCLLSGFNLIRAKQILRRKLKGACRSSWNPQGNPKSFTLTIPWNLAKPVKISRGIIAHQPLTVQKQMGLLREQYTE